MHGDAATLKELKFAIITSKFKLLFEILRNLYTENEFPSLGALLARVELARYSDRFSFDRNLSCSVCYVLEPTTLIKVGKCWPLQYLVYSSHSSQCFLFLQLDKTINLCLQGDKQIPNPTYYCEQTLLRGNGHNFMQYPYALPN